MELNRKQTEAIDALENKGVTELIYGGGVAGGKTMLGCYWIIKSALKYPETRWVIGRAVLSTLKETTLKSFYTVCKMQGLISGEHFTYNKNDKAITMYNGSEILLKDLASYPSDPEFDELGSLEITGAFVDECNQIEYKAWSILISRIRYKLEENGLTPKILGTCNPAKNWVYTYFYKPNRDGTIESYRKFIQALVTDNPKASKSYISNLLRMPEASKQRLLYGNWEFDDDPTVLIPRDAIDNLYKDRPGIQLGQKYLICDIARKGRDSTVITLWNGMRCYRVLQYKKKLSNEIAQIIEELRISHKVPLNNIMIDEDGIGGPVIDFIGCKGFINGSPPLKVSGKQDNYFNLKSQCYFKLAELINSGLMYVNIEPNLQEVLSEELGWVKAVDIDKDNKKRIISKEDVKKGLGRSPDISDCLMIRCWYEIRRKASWAAA